MAIQIIYLIISIALNRLWKGMTLKDHLLEAKKMFGPLLTVISPSHRAGELYALREL